MWVLLSCLEHGLVHSNNPPGLKPCEIERACKKMVSHRTDTRSKCKTEMNDQSQVLLPSQKFACCIHSNNEAARLKRLKRDGGTVSSEAPEQHASTTLPGGSTALDISTSLSSSVMISICCMYCFTRLTFTWSSYKRRTLLNDDLRPRRVRVVYIPPRSVSRW